MPAHHNLLDARGNPLPRRGVLRTDPIIRARYDAAESNEENSRHWAYADSLSALAANSPSVRRKLRDRARYECDANNSYAWGIVQTLANDTVGPGPRLQVLTDDEANNSAIEAAFSEWADAIRLSEKLLVMRQDRCVLGEAFALLTSNPKLDTPVQLDIRTLEADQVSTPTFAPIVDPLLTDGIVFDAHGNPVEYHVLRQHPGDFVAFGWEYDRIPAELMIHWFRKLRSGQVRGVPDVTPALNLFAQLRRYTLAVIAAAETAADFAAVLQTTAPPDGEAAEIDQANGPLKLNIDRRLMTTLPEGWTMSQFRAEQPTTNYEMFKREILNEIARCLNMPYNVAAGNSSGYNYASGRLDHQTYYKSIRVDQAAIECVILDPIFGAWLDEAELVTKLLPGGARRAGGWPHRWLWQGMEHVDPEKEANAQEIRLRNLMTTFSDECQRAGVDPEERARTIARDRELFASLGIPLPAAWQTATPAGAASSTNSPGE